MIRDRVARAILRLAQTFGLIAYWKNPGQEPIQVYALPQGGTHPTDWMSD